MTHQNATPFCDFLVTPNYLFSLKLKAVEKWILSMVFSFDRNGLKCCLTDRQFSDCIGESESTISRSIQRLVKLNFLKKEIVRKSATSTYRILEVQSNCLDLKGRSSQNDGQYNNIYIYNNNIITSQNDWTSTTRYSQNDPTSTNPKENMPTFQDALEAMIEAGFLTPINRPNEELFYELNPEFDPDEVFRLDLKQGDGKTLMQEPELFLTFEMKQRFNRWKAKSPVYYNTKVEDWDLYLSEIIQDVYRWSHRNGVIKKNWYLECLTFIRRNPMSSKAKLDQPTWARANKLATTLIQAFSEGNRPAIQQVIKENYQIAIALQHWTETYKIPKGQIQSHLAGLDTVGILAIEKKLATLIENELREVK